MVHLSSKTLLIIDDDRLFCDTVAAHFRHARFEVVTAQTGNDGMNWCMENKADVILLDQKLPDARGLELCQPLLQTNEQAKIIFVTAYPSFDNAVQALRNGAHDYLSKPMEIEELELAVERAFRTEELERVEQIHKFQDHQRSRQNTLVGRHGGLRSVRHLIELASTNRAPVLITGETGTGKNVVAKVIHYAQESHGGAFVGTNCAALPENLIESELFGHEKGAFTGATATKKGIFEMADGGTLFLDEIGDLPLQLQSKLLGVLDDGVLRRVGGQTARKVNVRIIAATNVNLEQAIRRKTFREDLYYRMSVLRIHLPPLRERQEDIEELCYHFANNIAPDQKLIIPDDELEKISSYEWPGNVRELRNIIERSIILRRGNTLFPSHLLFKYSGDSNNLMPLVGRHLNRKCTFCEYNNVQPLAEIEKQYIEKSLSVLDYNHTQTAKALGIARSTLLRKMETYRIETGVPK